MLWIGGGRWQNGRGGSSHADFMAGCWNDKTPMKFWCKFAASLGIAVTGALLVLSGGSVLGAANDALFGSSDQPASGDSQTSSDISISTVDGAIRGNSDIVALLGDDSFVIKDRRPVYVENELWGVSAQLRLDEVTTLNGPWITVETDALLQSPDNGLLQDDSSDLGVGGSNELTHEERDRQLSHIELTSDDYVTGTDTYEVTTELLLVTIQPDTSVLLTLVPFSPPTNLGGDVGPTNSSDS